MGVVEVGMHCSQLVSQPGRALDAGERVSWKASWSECRRHQGRFFLQAFTPEP
jgi:hypothetical protein